MAVLEARERDQLWGRLTWALEEGPGECEERCQLGQSGAGMIWQLLQVDAAWTQCLGVKSAGWVRRPTPCLDVLAEEASRQRGVFFSR